MPIAERLLSHVFSRAPPGRRGEGASPRLPVVIPPAISRPPLRGVALLPWRKAVRASRAVSQGRFVLKWPSGLTTPVRLFG